MAETADDGELQGLIQVDQISDAAVGESASTWVVLSQDGERLSSLRADRRWQELRERRTGQPPWTDDFSNVLGAVL